MIQFRCWYCNHHYRKPESEIGQRFTCRCQYPLRVPKRNGGRCRIKTPLDWFVQVIVYGGFGALIGFCAGLGGFVGGGGQQHDPWFENPNTAFHYAVQLLCELTILGFLIGALGGEWTINMIVRWFRQDNTPQ